MCGIAGIISLKNKPIKSELITFMTDEIKHRGPDSEGFLFTNASEYCSNLKQKRNAALVLSEQHTQNLAFGHRRLSILDLSPSASQPMSDASKRYWIVFNGEIYNHAALRTELKQLGCEFITDHSDTEVILNAYASWGVDCLQKFNGMWAFCIWDSKENSFFLSRDRAGKKPLYYTEHEHQLYFSSELKSLLTNREIPRIVDEKAVYDYLTYMSVPAPNTIFKNISKLPAAHYVLFKPGQVIIPVRYWNPFSSSSYTRLSEKEIIETLREKLYESARLRMLADVEVGVLLSGGLDSSINLACLSKFATQPIKAFSVGFENKGTYKNEFSFAEKVAKQFKADYHQLTLTENDFLDFFPEMVYYQDEPIADTANIPIYYIAKKAREQGVKVLLGGEGSDEIFIGYEHWRLAHQFAQFIEGKPSMASLSNFLHAHSPLKNKRLYYFNWYEKVRNNQPVFWSGTELRSEHEKKKMLSKKFIENLGSYNSFESIRSFYYYYKQNSKKDSYDWMTATDLQYRLPDLLLARLDRMLMAASVEGRNPFLDVNVLEFSFKIPPHLKTKNGQEKYILKKAFEGILTDDIIYRKKDSFTVPLNHLFKNQQFTENAMDNIKSFNQSNQIFSEAYIDQLFKSGNGNEIWNISNLAFWFNRFK